jgi:hypothetical protein
MKKGTFLHTILTCLRRWGKILVKIIVWLFFIQWLVIFVQYHLINYFYDLKTECSNQLKQYLDATDKRNEEEWLKVGSENVSEQK